MPFAAGLSSTLPWACDATAQSSLWVTPIFKIKLSTGDIDPAFGQTAATDIQNAFREHRGWHQDVACQYEDGKLVLTALNDFDDNGYALLDEFSDCLSAFLPAAALGNGALEVVSIERL
jgi:hypothetical protein